MTHDFPSDEDKALFRAHMQAVKPLNKQSTISNTQKTTLSSPPSSSTTTTSGPPPTTSGSSPTTSGTSTTTSNTSTTSSDTSTTSRDLIAGSSLLTTKGNSAVPRSSRGTAVYLSDFISEPVLSNSNLSYCKAQVPSRRFRALKNGQIFWKAKLDLHGFQSDAAREALNHFIQTQIQNKVDCVLIVHGKGGHSTVPPVIKNLVYRWLPQWQEVLAFHSAQGKDGGCGAVYVLLKKIKPAT